MNRILFTAALSLGLLSIGACSSDSSNPVDGGNGNGDDGITFADDIRPLFNASCSGANCHIGQTTNGVNLSSYAQVMASVGLQYGGPVVVAGNADASPIIDKVSNADPQFGVRMPNGRAPLSSAQIQALRTWIDEGALDN